MSGGEDRESAGGPGYRVGCGNQPGGSPDSMPSRDPSNRRLRPVSVGNRAEVSHAGERTRIRESEQTARGSRSTQIRVVGLVILPKSVWGGRGSWAATERIELERFTSACASFTGDCTPWAAARRTLRR